MRWASRDAIEWKREKLLLCQISAKLTSEHWATSKLVMRFVGTTCETFTQWTSVISECSKLEWMEGEDGEPVHHQTCYIVKSSLESWHLKHLNFWLSRPITSCTSELSTWLWLKIKLLSPAWHLKSFNFERANLKKPTHWRFVEA